MLQLLTGFPCMACLKTDLVPFSRCMLLCSQQAVLHHTVLHVSLCRCCMQADMAALLASAWWCIRLPAGIGCVHAFFSLAGACQALAVLCRV